MAKAKPKPLKSAKSPKLDKPDKLSTIEWSEETFFCSVSLGGRGCRAYVFLAAGRSFPLADFDRAIEPWSERDAAESSWEDYPREGLGCWHPVFPAGPEDIWLLTAAATKWLVSRIVSGNRGSEFAVFEMEEDETGFLGVRRSA